MEEQWTSAITKVEPNKLTVRGYTLTDLIGRITFSEMIFLVLKGELPTKQAGKVMEAILVASIDHGVTPPSTLAARTVASTGAPLNAALAAGVLSVNRHHGGAIEDCMLLLQQAVADKKAKDADTKTTALAVVKSYRTRKMKMAGFGHRIHTDDPRTRKLLSIASSEGISGEYTEMALALEEATKQETGKNLPLNVDGAIAALLCELGFPPALANALFIIARIPGLAAHVYEEITEQKPMRRISPTQHGYSGPEGRII